MFYIAPKIKIEVIIKHDTQLALWFYFCNPSTWRLRQDSHKFHARLGYKMRMSQKANRIKTKTNNRRN